MADLTSERRITPLREPDLTPDDHCLLSELEGLLRDLRQRSTSVKHSYVILAFGVQDIVDRYRELADNPPETHQQEELLDYLQGV